MKCWSCKQLISHKKVKWKPREIDFSTYPDEEMRELFKKGQEIIGENSKNEKIVASPNQIFGFSEYEYRGKCPECNEELTCFWRGYDSLSINEKNNVISLNPKPFLCHECENKIYREWQVWYSRRFQEEKEIKEYLITLCSKCHLENVYPFEYDLEKGIIE